MSREIDQDTMQLLLRLSGLKQGDKTADYAMRKLPMLLTMADELTEMTDSMEAVCAQGTEFRADTVKQADSALSGAVFKVPRVLTEGDANDEA